MTMTKQVPQGAALIPLDIHDNDQVSILKAQRLICGWGEYNIATWRDHIDNNERTMFWIALEADSPAASGAIIKDSLDFVTLTKDTTAKAGKYLVVGQIALDKKDHLSGEMKVADETLVAPDHSRLLVATLFVMPEFKMHRLGTYAMQRLEELALDPRYGSANCTTLTLTTASSRHAKGGVPGPEGYDMWAILGLPIPDRTNVGWFERLGYVSYKEEPRYYAAPGRQTPDLWVAFMEKKLPVD